MAQRDSDGRLWFAVKICDERLLGSEIKLWAYAFEAAGETIDVHSEEQFGPRRWSSMSWKALNTSISQSSSNHYSTEAAGSSTNASLLTAEHQLLSWIADSGCNAISQG